VQYYRLNIINLAVVVVLGIALFMAIVYGLDQLASIVASGLIGYIGGAVHTKADDENEAEKLGKGD
jgi:large-conductance mechanosensitive channel